MEIQFSNYRIRLFYFIAIQSLTINNGVREREKKSCLFPSLSNSVTVYETNTVLQPQLYPVDVLA